MTPIDCNKLQRVDFSAHGHTLRISLVAGPVYSGNGVTLVFEDFHGGYHEYGGHELAPVSVPIRLEICLDAKGYELLKRLNLH